MYYKDTIFRRSNHLTTRRVNVFRPISTPFCFTKRKKKAGLSPPSCSPRLWVLSFPPNRSTAYQFFTQRTGMFIKSHS